MPTGRWILLLELLRIGLVVSPVAAQPFAYVALEGALVQLLDTVFAQRDLAD
jgi:hypothetical protein